jgi:hypothetical protein
MNSEQIHLGKIYAVWMSRKLRPVLLERKRSDGLLEGRSWPNGKLMLKVKPKNVSQEYIEPGTKTVLDFKSRAAGEHDDE